MPSSSSPIWFEMPPREGSIDPHHSRPLTFHGYTVLLTEPDGGIDGGILGLFDYDTRILSTYRLLIDGEDPQSDTSAAVESDYWAAHLTVARPGPDARGPRLPQDALEIEIRRRVGGGMAEQVIVRNNSMSTADVVLRLQLDADFRDTLALGDAPRYSAMTTREWDDRARTLTFDHHAEWRGHRLHRASRLRVVHADSPPADCGDGISCRVVLTSRASWTATFAYESLVDSQWRTPQTEAFIQHSERDRLRQAWRRQRADLDSAHSIFSAAYESAAEDLFALRAWELDTAADAWIPNAAVPTYTGVFGRDSLTAAWQGALIGPDTAMECADRLLAPDMFSGWGIRTLSRDHPSYNPLAYHLGTVWPVENATFALGFKRYGLDAHLERLVTGIFDAAAHFRRYRLPEALGGHGREETPVPTVYPKSNAPQAWSASAVVQLAQTLLGIYPFAPAHVLALVRPRLPEWLPAVTIRNVRVGTATASIRFERGSDGSTAFDVIDTRGQLFIVEMPPPQEVDPAGRTWEEAVRAWILERAPGRLAFALRLALGVAA